MTAPTLAAFLRARWDEEEAVARLATEAAPAPWEAADRGWMASLYCKGSDERMIVLEQDAVPGRKTPGDVLDHIARHDPARVLADLASKRKIVELHEHVYRQGDGRLVGDEWACRTCPNEWHWCPTIRLLAEPYASHPEFRPEWVA